MDKVGEVAREYLFLESHVVDPEVIHMPHDQGRCRVLYSLLVDAELGVHLLQYALTPQLTLDNDVVDHGLPGCRSELPRCLGQMGVLQDLLQGFKRQVEQDPGENGLVGRRRTWRVSILGWRNVSKLDLG